LQAGSSLPAGITLAANGLISGTMTSPPATDTTYNFTVVVTDPQNQDASKAFSVSVTVTVDTNFQYTTLLLHADGTNNGNNHAFLDSSTNAFAITRNGNASQGSFSPFSPKGWSGYFDGTGDYISFTKQTTTSSFTAECWFYRGEDVTGYHILFSGSNLGVSGADNCQFAVQNDGAVVFTMNSAYASTTTAAGLVAKNQWSHIAFVRSGTSCAIFVNGIRASTGTSSAAMNIVSVGSYYTNYQPRGYISNARITTTAVYDVTQTTYTVPTASLTAISGTYLLTLQNNRFIDNSASPLTLTVNGDVSIQPLSPFAPTTAYSAATHGGSAYFDGSGDYLVTPSNANLSSTLLGSDFTIECWLYLTSNPSGGAPIWTNSVSNSDGFSSAYVTSTGTIGTGKVGTNEFVTTATVVLNAWNHFATVRSGSTVYTYLNGVQAANGAASTYLNTSATKPIQIAQSNQTSPANLTGYISGYRITTAAQYTGSTYTIPTAPPTAISGTNLLLNFTNAQIFDSAAGAVLETVGDAKVNTSVYKYGTGSIAFDGTGDYLLTYPPNTQQFAFGTGDFTVEFWVYVTSVAASFQHIYDSRPASTDGAYACIRLSGSTLQYVVSATVQITGPSISVNTWYHIAVSRVASQTKMFVNGTQVGSTYSDTTSYLNPANRPAIGGWGYTLGGGYSLSGYIDDFRVTKGFGRYPYNFTPPTKAFADKGGTETLTADTYFPYTTLLLPGNGTNNANNHAFVDSSNNAFAITRNGNATQGTFTPFSQTGWGNYFNTLGSGSGSISGDYLTVADNTAFALGSGDFTIEAWIFPVSYPTAGYNATIVGKGGGGAGSNYSYDLNLNSSGNVYGECWISGPSSFGVCTSSSTVALNQWSHIAYVRSGSNFALYVNGTSVATATSASACNTIISSLGIATTTNIFNNFFKGYISNLRLTKGGALYTANFTPSTTPLTTTVSAGTVSLLTCQSNRFLDNSANVFTVTPSSTGTPSVQAFSPFSPAANNSTSTNGGSGYFDGSGDYLVTPSNAALQYGTGDYTYECWIYHTSISGQQTYFARSTAGNYNGVYFYKDTSNYVGVYYTTQIATSNVTITANQWYYLVASRLSGTLRIFINGVQVASVADSTNLTESVVTVGADANGSSPFSGFMCGARILKGVGYSSITVPTSPPTAIANTSLLLNYTNGGITDATGKNVLETVGDTKISTTQSKFGGFSMFFDGTGDYLHLPATQNLILNGDFTIEMWVYPTNVTGSFNLLALGNEAASRYVVFITNGAIVTNLYGFSSVTLGGSISINTWTHVALSRYGSTIRCFVNGVQTANTETNSSTFGNGNAAKVGSDASGTGVYVGYIDDLRITKGIARYITNFTPPTSAFLLK
jgi:hypothetical protein